MTNDYLMHFGICVRDLERSIRFYRDGLGFVEAGHLKIAGEPTATLVELPGLELHAVYGLLAHPGEDFDDGRPLVVRRHQHGHADGAVAV